MKKCIVTIADGLEFEQICELTHPLMEAYAKRCKADLLPLAGFNGHQCLMYRKFDIRELMDAYDRVVYLDSDILIKSTTPSLFEVVPEDKLGWFNEATLMEPGYFGPTYTNFMSMWNAVCRYKLMMSSLPVSKYYNAGVLVMSKEHQNLLSPPECEVKEFFAEQTYLNILTHLRGTPIFDLPVEFNSVLWSFKGRNARSDLKRHLIHYAGGKVNKLKRIKEDLGYFKSIGQI